MRMLIEHFERESTKKRWHKTDSANEEVTELQQFRIYDAIPFFRRLGGQEICKHNKLISISPSGLMKTERTFWEV